MNGKAGRTLKLAALLLSAAAAVCAACFFMPSFSEPVTLTFWHVYASDAKESPMSAILDEFNKGFGRERGIIADGSFILESNNIDRTLTASVRGEPGAKPLPDLFTAYPRVSLSLGTDRLQNWGELLTEGELSRYNDDILADGVIDGAVFGLPIVKSTEVLFLNATAFDKFSAESGIKRSDLSSFEKLFDACVTYAGRTGKTFLHMNDFYNYFHAAVTSTGGQFVVPYERGEARFDLSTKQFERAFLPLARAALSGGLSLYDGFASVPWKTEDIITDIGSSAGLIYLREYVTRPDNTREDIETLVLPYPVFDGAEPTVVMRGGPLYAFRSADERRSRAVAEFAKWITTGSPNLRFALSAGYLPVTDEGIDAMPQEYGHLADQRARLLYDVCASMRRAYRMIPLPLYLNITEIQPRFERAVRQTLIRARASFVMDGGDAEKAAISALNSLRDELEPISVRRYASGE